MTVAKPNTELPGTDPEFHKSRYYLTPVRYKGRKILGSVASCRHQGCNWTATYATNVGRDIGSFRHRSEKVLTARLEYFTATFPALSSDGIEGLILESADKHSHGLEGWKMNVRTMMARLTGAPADFVPTAEQLWQLEVGYHLGLSARDQARKIFLKDFDQG